MRNSISQIRPLGLYNKDMSPLERMMRGYVAAKNEIFDVPLTTYDCETVEDACIASLHFLITHNCNLLKCQNCGKYFVSERSDTKYCDRMSPFNKKTTCKIDGAQRTHRKNTREDELQKSIAKAQNRLGQRSRRHIDDAKANEDYNNFSNAVDIKRKELKSGVITEEQFIEWLDKL